MFFPSEKKLKLRESTQFLPLYRRILSFYRLNSEEMADVAKIAIIHMNDLKVENEKLSK
jgi:hypothetical protein